MGASGSIGKKKANLTYDLAGVYNKFTDSVILNDGRIVDYKGWLSYGAIKYDNKKDFNFKLAYTYAEENSFAEIKRKDFNSYCMREETPYDDLLLILNDVGLNIANLKNAKVQVGYRFRKSNKHSLRFAYDKIETKNKNLQGATNTNTDLFTFEYRYQLSENTRIRLVYQNIKDKEGQCSNIANSSDQLYFTEIYARF